MLEKAILDTDPATTEVVVMTAKLEPPGGETRGEEIDLDSYDRQLMTAVVDRAERLGKRVLPLIVPTNNPLNAVLATAKDIGAQEVMLGASNKFTAEEQLDQIALYWINLHDTQPQGLTVHIVSADRDVTFDLNGGNRIPRAADREARTVADLRAAGIGIRKVLLVHDSSLASHDVFEWLLTMLASDVELDFIAIPHSNERVADTEGMLRRDQRQAEQLGRQIAVFEAHTQIGPTVIRQAELGNYSLIVLPWTEEFREFSAAAETDWSEFIVQNSPCSVFLASHPAVPKAAVL